LIFFHSTKNFTNIEDGYVPLPPSLLIQNVNVSIPSVEVPLKIILEKIDTYITKEIDFVYPSVWI